MQKYIYDTYTDLAGKVMPTLKSNDFIKTGMLTPHEFVWTGDYLVKNYPMWEWESVPEHTAVIYLPPDKQMLVLKNVPCRSNKVELDMDFYKENSLMDDSTNEWEVFKIIENEDSDSDLGNQSKEESGKIKTSPELDDEDDGYLDMENDIIDNKVNKHLKLGGDGISKTNTYTINITYDNYHRTPRIWLYGFNKKGFPLRHEDIYKDLSADHLGTTVTMEFHPYLEMMHVSVHPCRHARAMMKLMRDDVGRGKLIESCKYLIYFLKFTSCIMPNMDFDHTSEI
jgi:ubiquitin-like-conjugating enzyme ATG3